MTLLQPFSRLCTNSTLTCSHASAPPPALPSSPVRDPSPVTAPLVQSSTHPMTTRSHNNIHKQNPRYCLTSVVIPIIEPTSVTQAMTDSRWCEAMSEEFTAILNNGT